MNLGGLQLNLQHEAVEIYLAGCEGVCAGCHNPELKAFDAGEPLNVETLLSYIGRRVSYVQNIWVLGGEPLDQPVGEFLILLRELKKHFPGLNLWLWTRHNLSDVSRAVLRKVNYIKTGEYDATREGYTVLSVGVRLASDNQRIYHVSRTDTGDVEVREC